MFQRLDPLQMLELEVALHLLMCCHGNNHGFLLKCQQWRTGLCRPLTAGPRVESHGRGAGSPEVPYPAAWVREGFRKPVCLCCFCHAPSNGSSVSSNLADLKGSFKKRRLLCLTPENLSQQVSGGYLAPAFLICSPGTTPGGTLYPSCRTPGQSTGLCCWSHNIVSHCIHSFIHPSVHSLIHSSVYLLTPSIIHSSTHLNNRFLIYLLIYLNTHLLTS